MNSDLSDIAAALTQSISADGQTTITGILKFPNGTAVAPAFTFASDLTTGMYYGGTKKLGFSAGGTALAIMDQNNVGSGQTGNQFYLANTAIFNPVGMVSDFAGSTAPAGWLLCFGQVLNISAYPELGGLLGSTYGGNGTTTFGVPDCRGRATYGQDNMGGSTAGRITAVLNFDGTVLGGVGGAQSQTLTTAQLPASPLTVSVSGSITSGGGHPALFPNNTDIGNQAASGAGSAQFYAVGSNHAADPLTSTGNTSNLGSGTAHTILSPAIIFNKIIFAGRP